MTVKEPKQELSYYDDDMEIRFNLDDDIEIESYTESRYGWREAHIDCDLKPTFKSESGGKMRIELGRDD